jgi:RND family efflux transporter MFP subunit
MPVWKQLLLSLFLLVVAGGLWARFFPGAPETLERWGMDWAAAAVSDETSRTASTGGRGEGAPGGGFGSQTPLVVVSDIASATINDRLSAIGTGAALNSVSVTPFATGRLTEILVDAGTRVEAGTVIASLDSDAEEIEADRARIALEDARARLERVTALRNSNTATAVQLTEAQLALDNAQLQLRNAELALQRRSIVAPIAGVVGIMPVSAGNYVTTQTEIASIDDRSRLVVDFWVPERFATMIEVGQSVGATSVARPGERYAGRVRAIDNRVDAQSRTLRVQAIIDNPDDSLRAGMSFQVSMTFPGDSYPAVDPLAIQWGTEGAFVWVVEDGRARRTPVRIIQRNTDTVLVSGDFGSGGTVVTEGIHAVREGGELRAVRDDGAPLPVPEGVRPAETAAGT